MLVFCLAKRCALECGVSKPDGVKRQFAARQFVTFSNAEPAIRLCITLMYALPLLKGKEF